MKLLFALATLAEAQIAQQFVYYYSYGVYNKDY
jgi:hypothetical protein